MLEGAEINLELAKDQWGGLKYTIEKCGAEVNVIPGNTVYPDLVFTANSGIINDNLSSYQILNIRKDRERKSYMRIGFAKMVTTLLEFQLNTNSKDVEMHLFMAIT